MQVSYAIGVAEPTSIMVETFGTGKLSREELTQLVRQHFDLTPYGLREMLDLVRPIYQKTAAYGHFGREEPEFTWERTDKAEALAADAAQAAQRAAGRSGCTRRARFEVALASRGALRREAATPRLPGSADRGNSSTALATDFGVSSHMNCHREAHRPQAPTSTSPTCRWPTGAARKSPSPRPRCPA